MSVPMRNVLQRTLACICTKLPVQSRTVAAMSVLYARSTVGHPCCSSIRQLSLTTTRLSEAETETGEGESEDKPGEIREGRGRVVLDVDPETSIRYLNSKAYQNAYGNKPVWTKYKRNFKGQIMPQKTRKTCIRSGLIATGNPCPICRDDYLVIYYKNVELLKQFISPYTGEVLSYQKTNVCQKQFKNLLVAIEKAKDHGFIEDEIPFREYDYSKYYPQLSKTTSTSS